MIRLLAVACVGLLACTEQGEVLSLRSQEPVSPPAGPRPVFVTSDAGTAVPNPAADVLLSVAAAHGCAIVDQRLYCWGLNDAGQLGQGDTATRTLPTLVPSATRWVAVAAGYSHTCALDDLGAVYCWGANDHGQLGLGDRQARLAPEAVALPERASLLTTRFDHTCALLLDARLLCWGQNAEGQLGQGDAFPVEETAADRLAPVELTGTAYRAVGTGQGHTCAIALDGSLWCWGRNSDGELGTAGAIQIREPTQAGTDTDWLSVVPGQHHTCALKQDQSLWCWGANVGAADGEGAPLGLEGQTQITAPTRVGTDSDWLQLSTDTFHTCALKRDGELSCWGRGIEGQLGLDDLDLRPTPTLVGNGFERLAVGRFHTCAVLDSGQLACTGANDSGQLGLGDFERRRVFTAGE